MNVQLQFGGIFILLLLLYFYKRQGTLGLYTGRMFLYAMYSTLICLVLDILSVFLIVFQDVFPLWLVHLECKTYLVSLVVTGYLALFYSNADIHRIARADRFTRIMVTVMFVIEALIYLLPIQTFYDGTFVVYTYGPACIVTYLGALSAMVMNLWKLFAQGKRMNPRRRSAIRIWLVIWMIAAAAQFLNSSLLLVGYASALGIMILFFELENPEIYRDRETGFYNSSSLAEYLQHRYQLGDDCHGFLITFGEGHQKNITPERVRALLAEVIQYFRELPEATIFRVDEREFAFAFESEEKMQAALELVRKRFEETWAGIDNSSGDELPIHLHPRYLLIPTGKVAKNADELLALLRYFRRHSETVPEDGIVVLNDEAIQAKRDRDETISLITRAIREDWIEVFYQPIYSVAERRFVSAEALARIRRPDGSIVPPGLFIPLAEETGLVAPIGERVFEKTCRFVQEEDLARYGIEYVDVNLSVVQCEDENLAETYTDILKRCKLAPHFINLEITESAAIGSKEVLLRNMQTLLEYGVNSSLDDFGNGQSNLNYIVDMPFQTVKFDFDLTQAYFKSDKARLVMEFVTKMIHEMHLKVVSEGVETKEQLEAMEALGVDYIQGYYFSRPVDGQQFLEFLRAHNG